MCINCSAGSRKPLPRAGDRPGHRLLTGPGAERGCLAGALGKPAEGLCVGGRNSAVAEGGGDESQGNCPGKQPAGCVRCRARPGRKAGRLLFAFQVGASATLQRSHQSWAGQLLRQGGWDKGGGPHGTRCDSPCWARPFASWGGAAVPLMPPKMGDKWFCFSFSPVCRQRVKSTPHGVIRSPQANDDTGQTRGDNF